jgi:tetrahydromethanopterin S-methyltransferase subunit G
VDANLTAAIVSASGSALVAIVALVINSGRFGDMSKRIDEVGKRVDDTNRRIDETNQRIDGSERRIVAHIDNAFGHMELLLKLHEAEHHKGEQ